MIPSDQIISDGSLSRHDSVSQLRASELMASRWRYEKACINAQRGCTEKVGFGTLALLMHEEQCDFAPVQCSHEGCTVTVNRKDLVSHQESCDFLSVTCSDCQKTLKQKDYGNHVCVLRRELTDVKRMLQQMQVIKVLNKFLL